MLFRSRAKAMADKFEAATTHVKEAANAEFHDLCARHLYEMAASIIMLHLLTQNATRCPEMFAKSARVYANYVEAEVMKHYTWVMNLTPETMEDYKQA